MLLAGPAHGKRRAPVKGSRRGPDQPQLERVGAVPPADGDDPHVSGPPHDDPERAGRRPGDLLRRQRRHGRNGRRFDRPGVRAARRAAGLDPDELPASGPRHTYAGSEKPDAPALPKDPLPVPLPAPADGAAGRGRARVQPAGLAGAGALSRRLALRRRLPYNAWHARARSLEDDRGPGLRGGYRRRAGLIKGTGYFSESSLSPFFSANEATLFVLQALRYREAGRPPGRPIPRKQGREQRQRHRFQQDARRRMEHDGPAE